MDQRGPLHRIGHLALRFATSLSSAPPPIGHERWASEHFTPAEQVLWAQMSNQDRRHSALVAKRFAAARPEATRAEIAGALLHDVGKIECGLGTFARVVATVGGRPLAAYWPASARYLDHEAIGARLAADAGSDQATVELIAGGGPAALTLRACDHA